MLFRSLIFFTSLFVALGSAPDNGLGDAYDWVSFSETFQEKVADERPTMFIATKSYCGACKALKPQFAGSAPLQALSRSFRMVNVADDFDKGSATQDFEPSGGYIPRILFFDRSGEPLPVTGPNDKYPHFYSNPQEIIAAMEKALLLSPIAAKNDEDDDSTDEDSTGDEL
jgi:protein-disulfide reductase (glutathione)